MDRQIVWRRQMPDDIAGVLVPLSLVALTAAPLAGIAVAWFRFDRKRGQ